MTHGNFDEGEVLQRALASAAERLATENASELRESHFEKALAHAFKSLAPPPWASVVRQLTVRPKGWHGLLGGVDIALGYDETTVDRLVELKWGGSALWNCAWDVAKLALCVSEGLAPRGLLVAAAKAADWDARPRGAELFESRDWETRTFLDRFERDFAFWRVDVETRPLRLPAEWSVSELADVPVELGGESWRLRAVFIDVSNPRSVPVTYVPAVAEWRAGAVAPAPSSDFARPAPHVEPLARRPLPPEVEESDGSGILVSGEGGSVRAADLSLLITDEGTLSDLLDPEDIPSEELCSVRWFRSPSHRRAYLVQRGWLDEGSAAPEIFHVQAGSKFPTWFETHWDGSAIRYRGRTSLEDPTVRDLSVEPSEDDWRRFWKSLDGLKVWTWRQRYEPTEITTDGYMWSVRISAVGRICESSGYKAVPGSRGESSRSATWDAFMLAVSDLLGGAPVV